MGVYIGIDLGTTNSVAAYIDKNGIPTIIRNNEGDRITPSCVLFEENNVVVGKYAKRNSAKKPDAYVAFAKKYMGLKSKKYKIGNDIYTPEDISSLILRSIKKYVEEALEEDIAGAVISVPAYFTDAQITSTKEAAKLADINVMRIINEPIAAAIAYGLTRTSDTAQNILVYDLGGGTFDVCIIRINKDDIKVLSKTGDHNLGGYNFDKCIIDWFKKHAKQKGIELDQEAMQDLQNKAEEAKIALSSLNSTTISIVCKNADMTEELTRAQFEQMIMPYIYSTQALIEAALEEAELEGISEIDKFLLVGGSSRIPLVEKMIFSKYKIKPSKGINADEAVAIGAAYHAASLGALNNDCDCEKEAEKTNSNIHSMTSTNVKQKFIPQFKIQNTTSHGIGVVIYNEEERYYTNEVVVPKNTRLPVKKTRQFHTINDNQAELLIQITEGEYDDIALTTIIGESTMKMTPKPKRSPIDVTFTCDDDLLVHIHAYDVAGQKDLGEFVVNRKSNRSEVEFKEAKRKIGKLNI